MEKVEYELAFDESQWNTLQITSNYSHGDYEVEERAKRSTFAALNYRHNADVLPIFDCWQCKNALAWTLSPIDDVHSASVEQNHRRDVQQRGKPSTKRTYLYGIFIDSFSYSVAHVKILRCRSRRMWAHDESTPRETKYSQRSDRPKKNMSTSNYGFLY